MIKLKSKTDTEAPAVLAGKGSAERAKNEAAFDAGSTEFSFDRDIYAHSSVKERLCELQAGKCCFCEAKIDHITYGDVEHFRPKAGWVQDSEKLNRPGYYWLAYEWDNLFLSCQLCNQRHKKNLFPLVDNAVRAHSHHDTAAREAPFFIHPIADDPEAHITFNEEVPKPLNGSDRGRITIEQLGLDRDKLNDHRREKLMPIKQLYELAKDCPPTDTLRKEKAKKVVIEYFEKAKSDSTEYASMLRSFFQKNPLDF